MEIFEDFIVFPIDKYRNIAFLSTNDKQDNFKMEVDWSFPVNPAKPRMYIDSANDESTKAPEQEKEACEPTIQLIAVSEADNWLSFTTTDKSLFLGKIDDSSVVIKSRRNYLRGGSVMRFSSCGKFLFLADKTGDTFEYSCDEPDQPGRWVLGHISQILDLQINFDFK